MERITPSVRPEHIELIEERQESHEEIETKAGAVRSLLDDAARVDQIEAEKNRIESEMEQLRTDFESELEQKDARINELTQKLAVAHENVETTNELVRVVEDEQSIRRQKAHASLVERAKWWVTGMPDEES